MSSASQKKIYTGIGLAMLAVIIWSGNFIAARGVIKQVPPLSLAFYRWLTASIVIFPFAIKSVSREWKTVKLSIHSLFWTSLTGITVFNSFVYIGAHYTTAINLSLIGTTTSPIFAVILARVFLKEQMGACKITGIILCISGVLYLLSKGNFQNLLYLRFTAGDGWVLLAALSFAIYTIFVRRKPAAISSLGFLCIIFCFGTLLLFPFYIWELYHSSPVQWSGSLVLIILFLGIGASVVAFLSWNIAVGCLGAGRTALFGNLIPVFSSIEASFLLNEKFTNVHLVSMLLVFAGILAANRKQG